MISDAVLSDDLTYRYRLERQWQGSPTQRPGSVTWIMLNPSSADAHVDDPTVTRCLDFTSGAGYGRLVIVNLFALRATDPSALAQHPDPIGPANLDHIRAALSEADLIVAAWGAHPMALRSTVRLKLSSMAPAETPVVCLGRTNKGQPNHPGRLAASSLFHRFALP